MLGSLVRRLLHGTRASVDDARAFEAAGDVAAAERVYRGLLAMDPMNTAALHGLGAMLGRSGRFAEAVALLERAVQVTGDHNAATVDLGNAYWLAGQHEAAERAYLDAISAGHAGAGVHMNLGLLYRSRERPAAALDAFRRAYALEPERPDLLKNIVVLLLEAQDAAQALALCEAAAANGRDDDELLLSLGFALQKMHRPREALAAYARALAHCPDDAELHNNLAIALQDLGEFERAALHYERAIALKPDFRLARWHRSILRLLQGDFVHGWEDYDLRLASREVPARVHRAAPWNGEALDGRVVLAYGEQGLGDEIMFAGCLPDLATRARHVVVEASPRLAALFAQSFPFATVVTAADVPPPHPGPGGAAVEIPVGSLPQLFRRRREDFPAHTGYLRADPARVAAWRDRLAGLGPGLRIGLSWQGGTPRTRRGLRSLSLEALLPLLRRRPACFVNLQYGEVDAEIEALESAQGVRLQRWPEAVADFAESAALVCALDLVISVCNTNVHLAGALGRPVWVLAPHVPEWRYGIAGAGMPWYPSARMFRQPADGDWNSVIAAATQALRGYGL
ncbi:MAG: tetratricopeptide repeat protein [Burkholderiales bacterium]